MRRSGSTNRASEDATRTRHLGFYLALAEKARPELVGPDQGAWLARLDLERENLLSAHAWCDRADVGATLGLRLAWALKPYWINRGLLGLGHRMTVEALARAGAEERSLARCRGLSDAGQFGFCDGPLRGGARVSRGKPGDRARDRGQAEDREVAAAAGVGVRSATGHVNAARKHLQEALALARELGNKRELLAALNALAQLHAG